MGFDLAGLAGASRLAIRLRKMSDRAIMNKTINRLIVAVLVAAIVRGVVAAFGLDAMVAHLIERGLRISATSTIAQATAWIIAGLLGLGAFISC